jgi:hypothetical protein
MVADGRGGSRAAEARYTTGIDDTGCSSVSTKALGFVILTDDDGIAMNEDILAQVLPSVPLFLKRKMDPL